jgi:hypothetical protein
MMIKLAYVNRSWLRFNVRLASKRALYTIASDYKHGGSVAILSQCIGYSDNLATLFWWLHNSKQGLNKMDIKQINRKIGEIKRSGKALTDKIVLVELAAMAHCKQHNDSGALSRLVHAMPKSGRREALLIHIVDHAPLSWDKDKEVFKSRRKGTWNIEDATSVPFYEYTKETTSKLDLDKLIVPTSLIEAAQKRVEKAVEEGVEMTGDMEAYTQRLEVLKSIAA